MIGSLFSGIGGLELGLERAGLGPVAWQVELSPFCRGVLTRHWPEAQRYEDVRLVGRHNLEAVAVLCGGFPCQDLSGAATGWDRPGLAGERSGLWAEFRRNIGELQPETVVIENVGGKATPLWLPQVRRDLHVLGYASVAIALSAADVGALHKRARIFVVAHPHRDRESARAEHAQARAVQDDAGCVWDRWEAEPEHVRVAHGVSDRMDRLRALGNAVVPRCAQAVGYAIRDGWTRAAAT